MPTVFVKDQNAVEMSNCKRNLDEKSCRVINYGPAVATATCFSKIQIGFTFLVPAHLGSQGQWAVKRVCVCVRE